MGRLKEFFVVGSSLAILIFLAGCSSGGSRDQRPAEPTESPKSQEYATSGTIAADSRALEGVVLTLTSEGKGSTATATTFTDKDGNYVFNNLGNGTYTITPSMYGYKFEPENITVIIKDADADSKSFAAQPLWQVMPTFSDMNNLMNLMAIGGNSNRNIYAIGYSFDGYFSPMIMHLDKEYWIEMNNNAFTKSALLSIWVCPTNAFAVGENSTILDIQGGAWTKMIDNVSDADLFSVWGTDENNVYAAGTEGTFMHHDGTAWTTISTGITETFNSIWGSDANNVFAVGSGGTILHYDGTGGYFFLIDKNYELKGVWGSSPTNVFAVGQDRSTDKAIILRYNGTSWNNIYEGEGTFNAIWGASENNVFIVGNDGLIINFNGNEWKTFPIVTNQNLNGIWGNSENDVYAVGNRGTILHYGY